MCSIEKCYVLSLKTIMNIKFFAFLWVSRIIFKVLNQEFKKLYRKLERTTIKQISARAHRSFNETCLNIYINIYKEYNCLSFHARIKTKIVLKSLKNSLQTYRYAFKIFFFVFY